MNLLHRRPLAAVCFLVMLLCTAAVFMPLWCKAALGTVGLFAFTAILLYKVAKKRCTDRSHPQESGRFPMPAACCLVCLVCMLFSLLTQDLPRVKSASLAEGEHEIRATVLSVAHVGEGVSLVLRVTESDGQRMSVRADACFFEAGDISEGDILRFTSTADALSPYSEEDVYQLADGCLYELTPLSSPIKEGERFSLRSPMRGLRDAVSAKLEALIPGRAAQLYRALLLGEKSDMPLSASAAFRRLGVSHLLALSGLHLSVLLAFILPWLRRICPYRVVTAPLCCALVAFYACLTGGSVSILRAALMTAVASLSWLGGAKRDPLTALALSGALLLLFSPGCVYDCAFWLSFSATLGIIVLSPWLDRLKRATPKHRLLLEKLLFPLLLTLSATLFTLLPVAICFGRVSAVSLPANLLLAPMVESCLFFGLCLPLVGWIPLLGDFVCFLAQKWGEIVLSIAEFGASFPHETLFLNKPFIVLAILCLVLALLVLLFGPRRLFAASLSAVALFFVFAAGAALYTNMQANRAEYVHYSSYKTNDALLLSHGSEKYLILTCRGTTSAARAQTELLMQEWVSDLDGLVLAHTHPDTSLAWLERLLTQVRVATVYIPASTDKAEAERISRTVSAFHTTVAVLPEGEVSALSEDIQLFLWPEALTVSHKEAFACSLDMGGEWLTVLSATMPETPAFVAGAEVLAHSRTVIIPAHSPLPDRPLPLPVSDDTEQILLARENLAFSLPPDIETPQLLFSADWRDE